MFGSIPSISPTNSANNQSRRPLDLTATYEGLYGLNKMLDGTALPRLDEREIDALIHRDSLDVLGL